MFMYIKRKQVKNHLFKMASLSEDKNKRYIIIKITETKQKENSRILNNLVFHHLICIEWCYFVLGYKKY